MSAESEEQKKAFKFLRERCFTQESFTTDEFQAATGWSDASFKTYLSKQFRPLLIEDETGKYKVGMGFRRFGDWKRFRDLIVTQNRKKPKQYNPTIYRNLVIFEFFMPLRNEEPLRAALDDLFYKDSIKALLRTIPVGELAKHFPRDSEECIDVHQERVCEWVGKKFGGYSISHVSGRFRLSQLRTRQEALLAEVDDWERYLADETTAIVRFIFPCEPPPKENDEFSFGEHKSKDEPTLIRWFFHNLFVKSILAVLDSEDEVWVLESGLVNELHIYKAED